MPIQSCYRWCAAMYKDSAHEILINKVYDTGHAACLPTVKGVSAVSRIKDEEFVK